jgi:hypothetical protein
VAVFRAARGQALRAARAPALLAVSHREALGPAVVCLDKVRIVPVDPAGIFLEADRRQASSVTSLTFRDQRRAQLREAHLQEVQSQPAEWDVPAARQPIFCKVEARFRNFQLAVRIGRSEAADRLAAADKSRGAIARELASVTDRQIQSPVVVAETSAGPELPISGDLGLRT